MSKGKKRCHFCKCALDNQNRTSTDLHGKEWNTLFKWVDCCHACKAKEDKKP